MTDEEKEIGDFSNALELLKEGVIESVVDYEKEVEKINSMTQLEMARLWRYAPSGHIYFNTSLPYFKLFEKRFEELGGFTTIISKIVG